MGKITLLPETTKNPVTLIGERAGVCWGADINDPKKNYLRGLDCIQSGHGRTWEFVNIEMVLEGYSARVIREWYTHIGGAPTRLQASTRYIDYTEFPFITPPSVLQNPDAKAVYNHVMETIQSGCALLEEKGIPREDVAYLLPLGMETVVVDKRNIRNFIDMSRNRLCSRALWEFRDLMNDILKALADYSDEWCYICTTQMMPKCEALGYCPEKNCCGRMPREGEI